MGVMYDFSMLDIPSDIKSMSFLLGYMAITVILFRVFYNVYLHPLSAFPGPKIFAASSIPLALAQLRGRCHKEIKAAHDKYGSVVRIAPNELSFTSAGAWNDIYARREGKPAFKKDRIFFNDMLVDSQTLTVMNDFDHGRIRRAMAPGFSPRSMLLHESIIERNVELFITQIEKKCKEKSAIDLRMWYNYTTFDLIGDLAFGETFGCLENSEYHEWVAFVLDYFFAATLLQVVHRFYPLNKVLALLLPASLLEKIDKHNQMSVEKVRGRLRKGTDRPDFVHYMMKATESKSITVKEVETQASIFILAGSETTSVALAFATWFLLSKPELLKKLCDEVRGNFANEGDIDLLSINRLLYRLPQSPTWA
ncbi:hypothetical protein N7520_010457 [Penicillium odoratum]|uniref:uncharacterized protein n=1 Tax=Penicillium odoratum TaxID=1167516 RepID=UPI0025480DDE|nr:uncharacterized protein N7520_010457 [Penicillium odoratum]KAJ5745275.1 hypothetical protein N7520_010457 [Penicillium odoratum]